MIELLLPMAILVSQPWLALVPAALFILCSAATRSRVALVIAGLWALYCVYELAMKYRILCAGDCNIRIDLLALYPLLLVATVIGLLAVVLKAVRAGDHRP